MKASVKYRVAQDQVSSPGLFRVIQQLRAKRQCLRKLIVKSVCRGSRLHIHRKVLQFWPATIDFFRVIVRGFHLTCKEIAARSADPSAKTWRHKCFITQS